MLSSLRLASRPLLQGRSLMTHSWTSTAARTATSTQTLPRLTTNTLAFEPTVTACFEDFGYVVEELQMDSVKRKRKTRMNQHKVKKRKKKNRMKSK